MTCPRCGKRYKSDEEKCPHCGDTNPKAASGVFQTSTVLISTGGEDMVYRSLDEVPASLRSQLLKSTSSANSATILIADRRGRAEIARAMRGLPGPIERRILQAVRGGRQAGARFLLTRNRRIALALSLLGAITSLVWFAFSRR